jgi:phosphoribosylformylglycinamidine synthase subunit PurL
LARPRAAVLDQIALSAQEYDLIVERLGREPNELELGIVAALWSEHCGYKNSRPLLGIFPTQGDRVLTRAGEENAGAVDIGDGWSAVFKVESHNHPSAIEPYQGAATGVGGIVRDIFAMGAQPIALLDSLRFGPIDGAAGPDRDRNRYLVGGVTAGIAGYGNCLGVPTVGGETFFDPSYSGNPLVNAMCLGLAPVGSLRSARADGPGNPLILVGADTGKDGIHGATFASVELDERSEERRPAVQVGNPFLEKLLMEACQEVARTNWIVGLQDLGAAGLTSASIECAARSGTGIEIDVSLIPRREQGMSAYDIMLSESQERMLVIARAGYEGNVIDLFRHWELETAVIGRVTSDGMARVVDGPAVLATLPVAVCTQPPLYRREGVPAPELRQLQAFDFSTLPDVTARQAESVLMQLLASPNVCSKRWIFRQYDHQVLANTVEPPGADAAVLRLKGTKRGIAATLDGNSRFCRLDPFTGGAIAVAEAARNLVCSGAEPVAMTNCLNFGNPEKPDVYFQLEQSIRGMASACETLAVPVVSGNVSLYNETDGKPIAPTPVVGMVGVLEDIERRCAAGLCSAGDVVALLGDLSAVTKMSVLAGSEYAIRIHGVDAGRPSIDLDLEARLQHCCLELIRRGIIVSAHDCSEGGLAIALAECCIPNGVGLEAPELQAPNRIDAFLFGEAQSRMVVSVAPDSFNNLIHAAQKHGVPVMRLGIAGGGRLRIGNLIDLEVDALKRVYDSSFEEALSRD